MSQPYEFVNITKSQMLPLWTFRLSSTCNIRPVNGTGSDLALLIADIGNHENLKSLEQCCLHSISRMSCGYGIPRALKELLPSHLATKLEIAYLSQHHVGAWAGDRLIITGKYSQYSPFPPDGKWKMGKRGELYNLATTFSWNHYFEVESKCNMHLEMYERKIFDKSIVVANLDKKEYLDPQVYPAQEATLLDVIKSHNWCSGVLAGLFLKILHSTVPNDIGVEFPGKWAGDRIVICPLKSLEDEDTYTDTSNPDDVIKIDFSSFH